MNDKAFRKKLQVFISSTFLDLKDERQAAVEAILGFDHIPAGMELFKAGNESQLNTIKKWIDQSDLYLLILGGRYGSIEKESGKSYTQLEYEYAISKNIPVFTIILNDEYLKRKDETEKNNLIFEKDNKEKYNKFKKYVKTRMVKEVSEIKDIKIAIYESIRELERDYTFVGWIPGNSYVSLSKKDNTTTSDENSITGIRKKIKNLEDKLSSLELYDACHKLSYVMCLQYSYNDLGIGVPSYIFERDFDSLDVHSIDVFKHVSFYFTSNDMSIRKMSKVIKKYLKTQILVDNESACFIKLRNSDIINIINEWCLCGIIKKSYGNSTKYYSITKFGKDILSYFHDNN